MGGFYTEKKKTTEKNGRNVHFSRKKTSWLSKNDRKLRRYMETSGAIQEELYAAVHMWWFS